jgi:hypothetical protein
MHATFTVAEAFKADKNNNIGSMSRDYSCLWHGNAEPEKIGFLIIFRRFGSGASNIWLELGK